MSPAFFKSDVLLKYKNDLEKYRLEDRSILVAATHGVLKRTTSTRLDKPTRISFICKVAL